MTDLQHHIAYLTDHPADKAAALALADHFQEVSGYSRVTALRKVAAVRRAKWDREQMTHAAALLRSDSMWHVWLMDVIAASVGLTPRAARTHVLVRGRGAPKLHRERTRVGDGWTSSRVVTVGASWVLNLIASQLVEPRPPVGWNALLESK